MTDTVRPTAQAMAFDACVQQAAAAGRALMVRLIETARHSMRLRAGATDVMSERNDLVEALRLLGQNEGMMAERYPLELMAAFSDAMRGAAGPKASAGPISFDQLELMDEDQVQERVEGARALQSAMMASEQELAEFNALICAAQGLKTVRADRNPLRPEVYVRTLQSLLRTLGVPVAVRLRWMQHFGPALGKELSRIYEKLTLDLRSKGIGAAAYVITPSRSAVGGRQVAEPTAGATPAAASPRLTVDQLRRLMAGELTPADSGKRAGDAQREGPRTDFLHTVPAAFEALEEMKQVDTAVNRIAKRQAAAGATQTGSGDEREQLRRSATAVGQALGLEVVTLMIENLAHDDRLLAPVQDLVRQMELPLMRLALVDPRFFSDRKHPARALLEQMTQRSLAFRSSDDSGFEGFIGALRSEIMVLCTEPIQDASPFSAALGVLETTWESQEKHERERRDRAVQALLHAEQRSMLAETFAREFRAANANAPVPEEVVDFVAGPWAQVVAQARISDGNASVDPNGYLAVVDDLVWSIRDDLSRADLERLAGLIPSIVERLKAGLAAISYPDSRSAGFFNLLMELHQQALKPQRMFARRARALVRTTREQLEARFAAADADRMWLAPSEVKDSGFLDSQDALPDAVHFERTRPSVYPGDARSDQAVQQPYDSAIPVALNTWVELRQGAQWIRSRLTWVNPQGTLFVFTSADGVTLSMTRRVLDIRLAADAVRVLDRAVVDSALDAVANAALQNSLDLRL